MEPRPSSLCHVCDAHPGSRNYGSWTCQSCKIFFLRAATREVPFKCPRGGGCPIGRCSACRYQKCLDVGLIPEMAGRREGCHRRKKDSDKVIEIKCEIIDDLPDINTQETEEICDIKTVALCPIRPVVPYFDELSNPFENLRMSAGSHVLDDDFIRRCLMHEEYCNGQDKEVQFKPTKFEYSFDISINDVFFNPRLLCERNPIEFEPLGSAKLKAKDIERLPALCFTRTVRHIIDWYRSLPELWQLPPTDRNRFIVQRIMPVFPFIFFYYTYANDFDGLLTGLGCFYHPEGPQMFQTIIDFLPKIAAIAQTMIVPIFRAIKLTHKEYLLFKNALIFQSFFGLSEPGALIIRKARLKYTSFLEQHMVANAKDPVAGRQRFVQLMGAARYLEEVAGYHSAFFSRCVALNIGGMRGKLPIDVYFTP